VLLEVWTEQKKMINKTLLSARQFIKNIKMIALPSFFLCLFFVPSKSFADTLHLAVASNFITPIQHLSKIFEEETGHKLTLSFGSSGKLFAQIKHGAPYDIFLSADLTKPKALIDDQIAYPKSLVIYAKGQLALWSKTSVPLSSLEEALLNAKRIAIANPKLAPYGKAAEESLRHLSLWDNLQHKLVRGENIGQTYQFVYSQNADVGFVALSQVQSQTLSHVQTEGKIIKIPNTLYSDINQAAIILNRTKKMALAKSFMTFLMRVDTQAQIAQFGYLTEQH
jgi:molybdate transport system substrate-binding protein